MALPSIKEIENYFLANGYPKDEICIREGMRVVEPQKFVENMLSILKEHQGDMRYMPYYRHLFLFYRIVLNNYRVDKIYFMSILVLTIL